METTLLDIAHQLETVEYLDERTLTKVINRHNKRIMEAQTHNVEQGKRSRRTERTERTEQADAHQTTRPISKRRLIAYYLEVQRNDPERWQQWGFSEETQRRIVRTLQMKPRRTASGVATITVLTKPWKCSNTCLYCPNDLRMPKSYLADEPACQRAERTCFDPYAQVAARLKALTEMGHVTDKVELIILGGTWSDYPLAYQIWFVRELFRALNEGTASQQHIKARLEHYERAGISADPNVCIQQTAELQQKINDQKLSYNQAFDLHYQTSPAWQTVSKWQRATWSELEHEHHVNEQARHRVVGLVIETRPEYITASHALTLRRLGCTKIQMGIQSLDTHIRQANNRPTSTAQIQSAFETLRLFGFKTHIHTMVNLLGATPKLDKQDYQRLVTDPAFQPDEVKLYPCVLVNGTGLCARYEDGSWQPYSEEELVDVLVADTCATPAFTRISRMIRDISAPDIVAGNKKVNLRQLVESYIEKHGLKTQEIRHREVSLADINPNSLRLDMVPYETTVTSEYFLQWVTPEGYIAGFLRLSLPHWSDDAAQAVKREAAFDSCDAMIREVHVYGRVAQLSGTTAQGAQHQGLGTQLIEQACSIAQRHGYTRINVISAIGTRGYYRKLGFYDSGLYQQRTLEN